MQITPDTNLRLPHTAAPRPSTKRWHDLDAANAADLRRKHARDTVDQLIDRATLLDPTERALIEAIYRDGKPVVELAPLLAADPRVLRRRIRRIVRRAMSHEFAIVAQHRDRWPATRKRVATLCVLQGLSLREAASHLGISLHAVRRQHAAVQALIDHAYDELSRPARDGLSAHRLH